MSALSLMCRTAILGIALVVLAASGARAERGSVPAQLHRKPIAAAAAHRARHAAALRAKRSAPPAHLLSQNRQSTPHKLTPNEAGRTAGLAIRRQFAREQAARRAVIDHDKRSRSGWRSEQSQLSQRENRTIAAANLASAASMLPILPASLDRDWREASGPATRSARPVAPEESRSDNARDDRGSTNVEIGSAYREAPHRAADSEENLAETDEDAVAETSRVVPQPDASADSDSRTEEASLRIPRGAMPAPLFGSHESLERQNTRLDAEGLERIEDEADLADRIEHKLLVPIPVSSALSVNAELPALHRYCRPWTASFLADLARIHDAVFHRPLEVSSAVRTVEYQKRLMEINGNAAPAEGDIVSPHMTGATVDIAKDGLSRDELAWMRRHLLALEEAGRIDVEEEFRQACFHITVYKNYVPLRTSRPATQAKSGAAGLRHRKPPADSNGVAFTQGF